MRCVRVFKKRLDWEVETAAGMEVDSFDALQPTYLLRRDGDGAVSGCVRLLPSQGPNMLRNTFPVLLDGRECPAGPDIWESSRFALDQAHLGQVAGIVSSSTYELFAGMVEFGLSRNLSTIITVTDVRVERILRRAQWPLARLGTARALGNTKAVAGSLEISRTALMRLRHAGNLHGPALWVPVIDEAA